MREILYIQAGPWANYTGTHLWNTQECYFTYDETEEPLTDNDVSFREGVSQAVGFSNRGRDRLQSSWMCYLTGRTESLPKTPHV